MSVMSFCASELLDRAIQIEKGASTFYLKASEATADDDFKTFLVQLCQEEQNHAAVFTAIQESLSKEERQVQILDPGNEMLYYLDSVQEQHGQEGQLEKNAESLKEATPREILQMAVAAEKETILFYVFAKDYVPKAQGREAVEKVLREEMRHAAILKQKLGCLKM